MAKKIKKRKKIIPFKKDDRIIYNAEKPNRQARRLGAVAAEQKKQEKPKRVLMIEVLTKKVQQTKQIQERIIPKGMTYGEYTEYLKEKRQKLEEKKNTVVQ